MTMHTIARNTLASLLAVGAFSAARAQTIPTPPSPPAPAAQPAEPPRPKPAELPAYTLTIPVSRYQLRFVRVPAVHAKRAIDHIRRNPDGQALADAADAKPYYLSATEVTWDCLDPFVYRLDLESPDVEVDATTRPSKPYIPPDRGFGHEGFPAISITFRTAEAYCEWLTQSTGLKFRLPSEDEWEHAACTSSTAAGVVQPGASRGPLGWFKENSKDQTQKVGTREPNPWGLYDMLGNAGEWVVGRDGGPALKGGSFRTPQDKASCTLAERQDPSWNASDPQIPKSQWWLPDAPFTGFRLLLECDPRTGEPQKVARPGQPATPSPAPTPAPHK